LVSSRKARALLAYLAMHAGEAVDREQLADLLWSDVSDGDARHNLRQCIVTLRTLWPDLLVVARATVALAVEPEAVDVHRFARLIAERRFSEAAPLYGGEFVAALNLDIDNFREWVRGERQRIAALAAVAFENLASEREAAGDGRGAVAAAERLVAIEPLREDWQRLLIGLHARHLGRASAIGRARELAAVLKRDLNIGPEPATLSLIESIRSGGTHPAIRTAQVSV